MIVARSRIAAGEAATCGASTAFDPNADWLGPRVFLVSGLSLEDDRADTELQAVVAAMWGCPPGTRARAAEDTLAAGTPLDILAAGTALSELQSDGAFAAVAEIPEMIEIPEAALPWPARFDHEQDRRRPPLPLGASEELEEIPPASSIATECAGACIRALLPYLVEETGAGQCAIRYYGDAAGEFPAGTFATGCDLGAVRIVRTVGGNTLLVDGPDTANFSEYVIATSGGRRTLTPRLPDLNNPQTSQASTLAVYRELTEMLNWGNLGPGNQVIERQEIDGRDVIALYNGDPSSESWSVGWEGRSYSVDVLGASDITDRSGFVALMAEKRATVGDALRGGISWWCRVAVNSLLRKGYATCQRLPSPNCPIHRVFHPTHSRTFYAMVRAS
jgi:hypothetical protein